MATSPPQSSNQLGSTGDTLEHLRKAHLGFECGFGFLLCKKSGILLISGPLPNSDAKGWGPPIGRALEPKRGPWGVGVRSAKLPNLVTLPARAPGGDVNLTIHPRYHDKREFLSTTMRKGTSLVKCIRLLIIRDQHREFR